VSLRTRLLGAFAILAVIPLLALSVFEYVRSMDAVKRLVADQTSAIAHRTARQLTDRVQVMTGDLNLIATNAETSRMFEGSVSAASRDSARSYLQDVWRVVGDNYAWISIRDSSDVELERLADVVLPEADTVSAAASGPTALVTIPVRRTWSSRPIGSVVAAIRVQRVAPAVLFESNFGRSGFTLLADSTGHVIYDPRNAGWPHGITGLLTAHSGRTSTAMTLAARDTTWIATAVTVPDSPFAVISASAADEFSKSFAEARALNLVVALILTMTLAIAFILITRRTTRPLETLAIAASEVGRGNFRPRLPPAGRDEVGRLSESFATMSAHVDRMMAELEANRQMAAVGSFARQIAHEIRNPLTSIKLNLQALEHDVRDGVIPADRARTVEICLDEIQRLDRVVRGVLKLGRGSTRGKEPKLACIPAILGRALDVVRPQLDQQGIAVSYKPTADNTFVEGDEEQLVGMFLNLFVNAAEAMPTGGRLRVTVDASDSMAKITVADSGPGVPVAFRGRIFEPFYTTKPQGAGIGLAAATRDAEQHRGRLSLLENTEGATFIVELPVARMPSER
jgi:signal transduction histidine kinase